MKISWDYVKSAVPKRYPPQELVPPQIRDAALRLRQDTLRRSLLWTAAIFAELWGRPEPIYRLQPLSDKRRDSLSPMDFDRLLATLPPQAISVGLLAPELETPGFGVIIRSPQGDILDELLGELIFPRLDAAFPVIVSHVEEDAHLNAPRLPRVSPIGGCATCWAVEQNSTRKGILTAKHCTNGFNIGSSIPLFPGGAGVVIRKGIYSIDAAFISVRGQAFSGRSPMAALPYPTAGMSVVFYFPTGYLPATIKDVTTNNLGILDDHNLPMAVFTDAYGVPGQSGSLSATRAGEGVGIYLGTSKTPSGLVVGRLQHLEQARLLLNIELFK